MIRKLLAVLDSDGPKLYTLLVRLTLRSDVADDLLQDLFVKAADCDDLSRIGDLHAYLRRMAINLAFDWRRSRQLQERLAALIPDQAACQPPVWLRLAQHEQADQILTAAAQLSELQRQAFALRYVHDESYEQIGRTLGRMAHQARGLCHAAIKEIRSRLVKPEPDLARR